MSRVLRALALGALAVGVPGSRAEDTGSVQATVVASPFFVSLALAPARIGHGQTSRASATVTNVGPDRVRDVTLALRSDPPALSVTGANPRRFASIASAAAATGEWTVCGRGPAGYVLVAQARGRLPSGAVATGESAAHVLTITGPPACR
jgi:hypothetical protein